MGLRVLLISPAFHGYWQPIAASLEERGHRVVAHAYDARSTWAAKVRGKITYEVAEHVLPGSGRDRERREVTKRALTALRSQDFDVVLAIKADLLEPEFWAAVHERSRLVLWMYDELRRTAWTDVSLIDALGPGKLLTYSRQDLKTLSASGFDVDFHPNSFDDRYAVQPERRDEIVFIGAGYPNRRRALTDLEAAGVPVRAFGRDWSKHWFDRARTWNTERPDIPSERDVDRSRAYNLLAGAAAALNVHSDQDGFTMRTFEIPGSGGLQLIDRPDIAEFYEPGSEVLVYSSPEELVDLCDRARHDSAWASTIKDAGQRRTLAEHTFRQRAPRLETWLG